MPPRLRHIEASPRLPRRVSGRRALLIATLLVAGCASPHQQLGVGYAHTSIRSGAIESGEHGGWIQYGVAVNETGPIILVPHAFAGMTAVRGIDGDGEVAFFDGDVGVNAEVALGRRVVGYVGGRVGLLRGSEWMEDSVGVNYARGPGFTGLAGAFIPVVATRAGFDVGLSWLAGHFSNLEFLETDPDTGSLVKVTDTTVDRPYSAWRVHIGWRGPFSALNPLVVTGRQ